MFQVRAEPAQRCTPMVNSSLSIIVVSSYLLEPTGRVPLALLCSTLSTSCLNLKGLQLLVDEPTHDLLENSRHAILAHRALEIPDDTLLDDFPHDINLDIDLIPHLLPRRHHPLLRIRNQHDLEPALGIIDLCDRQRSPVERHIALFHHVAQHAFVARLQTERDGVAVGRHGRDRRHRVDVALHEMPAHARRRTHRPLQVDAAPLRQRAQVRPPQRLGRHADFEKRLLLLSRVVELGHRQARPVDRDRVAQRAIA